jgi:hypothetical protein
MADMTKKHHNLILDAVAEGVAKTIKELGGQGALVRTGAVQFSLTKNLGQELCDRLNYTHDKFDSVQFQKELVQAIQKKCRI